MSNLMEIWHSISAIVTTSDWLTLVIAAVVVIVAGILMESYNGIVTTTVLALIGFAILTYVRAVTLGGQNAMSFANTDWHSFLAITMLTLIAYSIMFAILILVVHSIRSALR